MTGFAGEFDVERRGMFQGLKRIQGRAIGARPFKRRNHLMWTLSVALFVGLLVGSMPADAVLFPFRQAFGVNGRFYWIDPGLINPAYAPIIRQGVSSWNGIGQISWSETTDFNNSAGDFFAKNYSPATWRGATFFFRSDGTGISPYVENWYYAEARLNDEKLRFDCCTTKIQNTAAHEFGHVLGIDHTSLVCALMYSTIESYDNCGIYTPQQNDDVFYGSQLQ